MASFIHGAREILAVSISTIFDAAGADGVVVAVTMRLLHQHFTLHSCELWNTLNERLILAGDASAVPIVRAPTAPE